jgi:diketogulonate reductase-like aldo/keto reductase
MSFSSAITLRDKQQMPQLGFGVWQVSDAEAEEPVGELPSGTKQPHH